MFYEVEKKMEKSKKSRKVRMKLNEKVLRLFDEREKYWNFTNFQFDDGDMAAKQQEN